MSSPSYDHAFWEALWTKTLQDHGPGATLRGPSQHLIDVAAALSPGTALDAGCGHGAETLWLAARGWNVVAVDFAERALTQARSTAERLGPAIAERVDFRVGDLATWPAPPGGFDLVVCLYVHIAGDVAAFVSRMGEAVAKGGHLLLVGHRPVDPATGLATAANGQVQVSVEAARAALDAAQWELSVAEERPRPNAKSGVDAVVFARKRSA